MKIIFISESADKAFINYMNTLGHVIPVPEDKRFDSRIGSHPDLIISIVDNILLIDANAHKSIFRQLDALRIPYIRTGSELSELYPYDIAYNAVVTKGHIIHKLKYTQALLLQHCKNTNKILIDVKQGYSKCSTVVIDDRQLITADQGIYQATKDYLDVLLVQPGFVALSGFDSGFLGGASGVIDDTVIFHGDLSQHPDFLKIKDFIEGAGKDLLYFSDLPLTDIGSVLVLDMDDKAKDGREKDDKDRNAKDKEYKDKDGKENRKQMNSIYTKHVNIPIFISHEGCPNDCVFCNQRKITARTQAMTIAEVTEQVESYSSTIGNQTYVELAFFGGSFTGIDAKLQEEYLSLAYEYKQSGKIHAIRLSTRPDYINLVILDRLKRYGVDIIELGVQSLDEDVIGASKRGHQLSDVYNAVNLIKSYGFGLGIQLMVGLPEDTKERSIRSAELTALLKPDFVRIYPTLVIRETELAELCSLGAYRALTLDMAVEWTKEMYKVFLTAQIPVIRIGLQPTELITEGKEVLYGPFHPSFRQLVESEYFYDLLDEMLKHYKDAINESSQIKVLCNPKDLSQVIGHKRKNITELKKNYHNIKISADSNVRPLTLNIVL